MGWLSDVVSDPIRAGTAVATLGASEWLQPGAPGGNLLKTGQNAWDDISGKSAADAAEEAARLQAAGGDKALAENMRQFDINQKNIAPWLASSKTALAERDKLMGFGGDTAGVMRSLQSSPGYQARFLSGNRSNTAQLSARGGMGSGKSLVAGNMFNQDYASQEYGNRLNQLELASRPDAVFNANNAGTEYAKNQGNIYTGVANAQGAAGIAGANARQSGLLGLLGAGATIYGAKR